MKTLYDELNYCKNNINARVEGWQFKFLSSERVSIIPPECIAPEVMQHLSEAATICYRGTRDKIIKRYAEKSHLVESVLEGRRSFYDLGKPIVEHVTALEAKLANGEIRRVKKRDIIGRDGRAIEDVAETVECLRENGIIDTGKFFRPVNKRPNKILGYLCDKVDKQFRLMVLSSVPTAAVATYFLSGAYNHNLNQISPVWFFGTPAIFLSLCSIFLGLSGVSNRYHNDLAKQRNNFEKALGFLDEEVVSARETLR